jgi:hypothetical protein
MFVRLLPLFASALLLAGCDLLGLGPDPRIAQREADGRAVGAACRYALRGIEDCYRLNERAPKTAVFEGWKEMDQYMRENKIEGAPSKLANPAPSGDVMLSDQQSGDGQRDDPAAKR